MAASHFQSAYCGVEGVDVSDSLDSQSLDFIQNMDETFLFNDSGLPTRTPTTRDATLTISVKNADADESAATGILYVMYTGSILGGGTGIYTVVVRAAAGATATTAAPSYTMEMVADGWSPIMGGPGSLQATQTITFKLTGSITRATS